MREDQNDSFGSRIRRAREEKNLTQKDLADQVEKDEAIISKWERGKNLPQKANISRLAEALGVSAQWLRTGKFTSPANETIPLPTPSWAPTKGFSATETISIPHILGEKPPYAFPKKQLDDSSREIVWIDTFKDQILPPGISPGDILFIENGFIPKDSENYLLLIEGHEGYEYAHWTVNDGNPVLTPIGKTSENPSNNSYTIIGRVLGALGWMKRRSDSQFATPIMVQSVWWENININKETSPAKRLVIDVLFSELRILGKKLEEMSDEQAIRLALSIREAIRQSTNEE